MDVLPSWDGFRRGVFIVVGEKSPDLFVPPPSDDGEDES